MTEHGPESDPWSSILAREVNRRALIREAAMAGVALTGLSLLGCGGPSQAAASKAAPASGSGAAGSGAAGSAAAGAGASPSGGSGAWQQLIAAAKKEGQVVVTGSPEPAARSGVPAAIKKAFGIDVQYLVDVGGAIANRAGPERAAGQYTIDASFAGVDSSFGTFLKRGWLDPLKPALVAPDLGDSVWRPGHPLFRDPKQDTVLQILSAVTPIAAINTKILKPQDVPTAESLLDPKFKGKICGYDPSVPGIGVAVASALYTSKGQAFCTKLYRGQKVALTRNYNQVATWLAHGSYPIALGLGYEFIVKYVKSGAVTVQYLLWPDAEQPLGGSWGDVCLWNHAPHPNAAKLFCNWAASKEGSTLLAKVQYQVPVRNDIDPTWVPPVELPKPGVKYLDTYTYQYVTKQRLPIEQFFQKLLA